ncbi:MULTISPECIES: vitamin K epoxide reductase family protein [Arsenicicoccus]|uniref:vitamin K epoxide reductase family protein n=1 Tax=Arsenicicoccus TaxID=267408 RepID=UPI00257CA45D|nr:MULTISPECIES: vitamin K epoxide reductase family protein [Arsenicicoccus]
MAEPVPTPPKLQSPGAVGRGTAWTLTLAGLVGLVAAFVLLVEKIALLTDPSYVPSCSINPVLSCGSIMNTDQAAAFGFPNPILGIAGFAALLTVGVVLLTRVALPGWFWWGIQAGTTFGVVFVHWLIIQSLYRIGALCPYCMIVWVVAITAFVTVTAHNIRTGQIPLPARLRAAASYAPTVVIVWLVTIVALITLEFWDYWVTLVD